MSQRKQVDTEKWHIGQEVTITNNQNQIVGLYKVTKLTKTHIYVQTNDSGHITKFDAHGVWFDNWSRWSIHPTSDRDRTIVERRELIYRLEKIDWSHQSPDQLKAVINLLSKPLAKERVDEQG